MQEFYVYVYLDPRKPGEFEYSSLKFQFEPFYIGKGKGLRMYRHLSCKGSNRWKNNKIKKILELGYEPIILKLKEDLTDDQAREIECEYIKIIGRGKDGPLLNLNEGGEGGAIDNCKSPEFRQKMRVIALQWLEDNPEGFKERNRKRIATRKKNFELGKWKGTFTNRYHSNDSKEKIGKANSIKQKGVGNSQFGSCWISNEIETIKIKKNDLEYYISKGWIEGRKLNKWS